MKFNIKQSCYNQSPAWVVCRDIQLQIFELSAMKNIIFFGLFLLLGACEDNNLADAGDCPSNNICTEVYVTVAVNLKNQQGKAYTLDEYYTTKISSGEKLPNLSDHSDSLQMNLGIYPVISDTQMRFTSKQGENFEFTGKKAGKVVVQKIFKIAHDCCHVKLMAGEPDIVIPE